MTTGESSSKSKSTVLSPISPRMLSKTPNDKKRYPDLFTLGPLVTREMKNQRAQAMSPSNDLKGNFNSPLKMKVSPRRTINNSLMVDRLK